MKEIQGDTGARRFTHGQEVSDQGFKVANGRPYVMYNGWRKEVVLCAPEHLRAFFRGNVRELRELAQMREELGLIELPTWIIIPSVYKFLPTRANRLLKHFTQGFKEFNLRMIALAEKRGTKIALQDIFNVTGPQGQITLEQFLHTIDEILLDNLEVSAAALSYLLINVAGDVQLQQKLRDEARPHLQSAKEQGFEQYLGRSNTLLEFCCAESRRLCPVDWFSPPERSHVDKTVDGYHIPAGTDVSVDMTRVNIHSPLWSRPISTPEGKRQVNGYDFCPERFNQIARMESSYNVVGFGVSARQCLGQHFASLLMRVVLVQVVSNYRITTNKRAWDCGFRQDRTVLAPKPQEILFEELEPLPL
ncbi:hypothetical protein MY1884_006485 [Beauveria asiatica]